MTMKIALLGNLKPGYICPMTQGLYRMLSALHVDVRIFSSGLSLLLKSSGIKGFAKNAGFYPYMKRLAQCDAIIVIQHLRDAFQTSLQIERLRCLLPDKPILLYDLTYLPTVGRWGPWLNPFKDGLWGTGSDTYRGLERYDWYLCVSQQNRLPMPPGEQPCSEIGIHLDDGTLFPEQNGSFKALVDFEREAFPEERKIQLEALEETGTEYIVLNGRYSIADIRAVYRTCSIYFLAHMESFGVPICELQACGSRILTPYSDWCDAHRLPRNDELPPNFTVYSNSKKELIQTLRKLKADANPRKVIERFREYHGHFITGNPDALQDVLDKVGRNEISGRSHLNYTGRTAQIPERPADTKK